nr:hypothetical protein [uncultured Roseateles sp.]
MNIRKPLLCASRKPLLAALLGLAALGAQAAEAADAAIEKALAAAQQDKRGITVYVRGQTLGGAVVRLEPGQWVELRNQQFGRIVVRLDRIDAVALP